jgi:hypothetical protein
MKELDTSLTLLAATQWLDRHYDFEEIEIGDAYFAALESTALLEDYGTMPIGWAGWAISRWLDCWSAIGTEREKDV